MAEPFVSEVVIERLPLYLRTLQFLEKEGKQVTSSQELAERLDFSSAQIRKDLAYFGEFGKQGTGYNIKFLQEQLRRILQIDQMREMALIGVGDLGRALANYGGFVEQGFRLITLFDNAPQIIGMRIGELTVQPMTELTRVVQEKKLQIVILAVPAPAAQHVANQLIELGVRAILNYAPISLSVPSDVRVYNIDPVIGLQSMAYYLK
jgi:redox-sensing transcriptional repressor